LPFFFQPTYLLLVRCLLGRQISPGIYIIMIVYFHHNILTPDNSYKWYTIPRIYVGRYDIQLIYYIVAPKHIETLGSPTLKQPIQTVWYTYHQRMNENPGYTQWFKFSGFRVLI
jgi:hypothetical protein